MNRFGWIWRAAPCLVLAAAVAGGSGCSNKGEECWELSGYLQPVTSDTLTTRHEGAAVSPDGTLILFSTDFFSLPEYDFKEARDFAVVSMPLAEELRTPTTSILRAESGSARRIRLSNIPGDDGATFDPNELDKFSPTWHPDGERFAGIVQNSTRLTRLYVARILLANAGPQEIPTADVRLIDDVNLASDVVNNQYWYNAPAFSPSGEWLAYQRFFFRSGDPNNDIPDSSQTPAIYAYNLNDGRVLQVTPAATGVDNPCWSPDGTTIAFEANYNGTEREIYTILFDPNATEPVVSSLKRLTISNPDPEDKIPVMSYDPGWLPSGLIVFTSTRRAPCTSVRDQNIWVMNEDGSDQRVIFFTRVDDYSPAADPSGNNTVVFSTLLNRVPDFFGQKADLWVLKEF